MRYPKFVNKNDTIAFVATSFGAATEPYVTRTLNAKKKFEKLGHNVIVGESAYKQELPYLANKPEILGKEFMDFYLNSDAKILISVGGGEMQFETLPFIDFEKISKAEAKWFDGFSDNTNYSFLFPTLADTAAIYGHCAGRFGMYKWHQSITDDYKLFTGEKLEVSSYPRFERNWSKYQSKHPLAGFNLNRETKMISYPCDEAQFEGRLLGGCLDILTLLCGTKYDKVKEFNDKYADDGIIWFLEACDLTPLGIRRTLTQLKMAGWFDKVKGFLIGRPANAYDRVDCGVDRFNALDVLKDLNVPILMDLDIGHLSPAMPLICGAYANVSFKDNKLDIKMMMK